MATTSRIVGNIKQPQPEQPQLEQPSKTARESANKTRAFEKSPSLGFDSSCWSVGFVILVP